MDFTGERIVPEAEDCEPTFAKKMYQEHIARYFFASQFCTGKTVLDMACGVGYGSKYIASNGAKKVEAIDISRETIRHARQHYSIANLQFHVWDIQRKLPFRDTFDVIICFEAIEHVREQARVIENMKTHLSSEGVGILSTPRPLGQLRSSFHEKELEHYEFNALLSDYFEYISYFVQNNHFVSLLTTGQPLEPYRTMFMNNQWDLELADYFVAVVSQRLQDLRNILPTMVFNDDSYVLTCEKDIRVLKANLADLDIRLKAKESALTTNLKQLKEKKKAHARLKQSTEEKVKRLKIASEENIMTINALHKAIVDLNTEIELQKEKNATLITYGRLNPLEKPYPTEMKA